MAGKRSHAVRAGISPGSDRQHYATFKVELLLDQDNNVRRTRVTHVQNDSEDGWAGWAEPRLVEFFVRNAGLHIPLPEPISSLEAVPPLESLPLSEATLPLARSPKARAAERLPHAKLKSELSGVLRVSRLATVQLRTDAPPYVAHVNEAFHVRLLLDFSEVKTTPSISLDCVITIWAKRLGTGARQIVGEGRSTFMPLAEVPCTVESVIPLQGTYRLEALVTLTPASTIPSPHSTLRAWLEGGLLQVY
jgi:hypothetical protein